MTIGDIKQFLKENKNLPDSLEINIYTKDGEYTCIPLGNEIKVVDVPQFDGDEVMCEYPIALIPLIGSEIEFKKYVKPTQL